MKAVYNLHKSNQFDEKAALPQTRCIPTTTGKNTKFPKLGIVSLSQCWEFIGNLLGIANPIWEFDGILLGIFKYA